MRSLEEYLALPYVVEFLPEAEGGYTATHPELPGCVAWGDSAEEALANLADSRETWIAGCLERGLPIPEPVDEEATGRVTLRLPIDLHTSLAREARRKKVSLNTLLVTALAQHRALEQVALTIAETLDRRQPSRAATVVDLSTWRSGATELDSVAEAV